MKIRITSWAIQGANQMNQRKSVDLNHLFRKNNKSRMTKCGIHAVLKLSVYIETDTVCEFIQNVSSLKD